MIQGPTDPPLRGHKKILTNNLTQRGVLYATDSQCDRHLLFSMMTLLLPSPFALLASPLGRWLSPKPVAE